MICKYKITPKAFELFFVYWNSRLAFSSVGQFPPINASFVLSYMRHRQNRKYMICKRKSFITILHQYVLQLVILLRCPTCMSTLFILFITKNSSCKNYGQAVYDFQGIVWSWMFCHNNCKKHAAEYHALLVCVFSTNWTYTPPIFRVLNIVFSNKS